MQQTLCTALQKIYIRWQNTTKLALYGGKTRAIRRQKFVLHTQIFFLHNSAKFPPKGCKTRAIRLQKFVLRDQFFFPFTPKNFYSTPKKYHYYFKK